MKITLGRLGPMPTKPHTPDFLRNHPDCKPVTASFSAFGNNYTTNPVQHDSVCALNTSFVILTGLIPKERIADLFRRVIFRFKSRKIFGFIKVIIFKFMTEIWSRGLKNKSKQILYGIESTQVDFQVPSKHPCRIHMEKRNFLFLTSQKERKVSLSVCRFSASRVRHSRNTKDSSFLFLQALLSMPERSSKWQFKSSFLISYHTRGWHKWMSTLHTGWLCSTPLVEHPRTSSYSKNTSKSTTSQIIKTQIFTLLDITLKLAKW